MLVDWKSAKVDVHVWMEWTELVYEVFGLEIDSTALLELFKKYNPNIYSFDIRPTDEDDDD